MNLEKPHNILLIRRAAIGDVIMTTGVVRELKKRYGDNANIDIATEQIGIFRNNPHVRNVMHINTGIDIREYNVIYNLDDSYEYNPLINYVDNYFYQVFGTTDMDKSTELFPDDGDRAFVDADLAELGDKFIVVHMRNWHWPAKNISMDIWLDVYTKLFEARADFKIVTVGGPTDFFIEDHPLFFDARTRYNDQQLKYLCDNAACFVGIDSGPFWAASASVTHMIALLTHLHPDRILPHRNMALGHNCTVIQTNEDCAGCNDVQARPVRQLVCQKSTFPCAGNFDSQRIADAILKQL